jgi:hypothetical protein
MTKNMQNIVTHLHAIEGNMAGQFERRDLEFIVKWCETLIRITNKKLGAPDPKTINATLPAASYCASCPIITRKCPSTGAEIGRWAAGFPCENRG